MEPHRALPTGVMLDGKYRLERVLGAGGFGITYGALDEMLGMVVAIKECVPTVIAVRDDAFDVRPRTVRDEPLLERILSAFLREGKLLARLHHPAIVGVVSVFEAHCTAYMVMRFESGRNLQSWLASLGRPPTQGELDAITLPILDALELVHSTGILHRDIGPNNILLRPDGSPCLVDFGAARHEMGEITGTPNIIKHGFVPPEQYVIGGKGQGPWTDIYALGAMLYFAVTGNIPVEATQRMQGVEMPAAAMAASGKYRPEFLAAIDRAMSLRPADRPQSVAQWRKELFESDDENGLSASSARRRPSAPWLDLPSTAGGRALTTDEMTLWSQALASARSNGLVVEPATFDFSPPSVSRSGPGPIMPAPVAAGMRETETEASVSAPERTRRRLALAIAGALVASGIGFYMYRLLRVRDEERQRELERGKSLEDAAERQRRLKEEAIRRARDEQQQREREEERHRAIGERQRQPVPPPEPDADRNLPLFLAGRSPTRVDLSVFAPAVAAPQSSALVQVFLHTPPQAARAAVAARMMDAVTDLKGTQRLEMDLAYDARVDITLSCSGLMVEEPVQRLRWRDEPVFAQFVVTVPAGFSLGSVLSTVRVSVNGDIIGRITFRIAITLSASQAGLKPAGEAGGRYRYAFVSYASEDRRAVLERVQMLQATRTEYFQDVLSLDPGERWERALYKHIDDCDLFLLFWSKAARSSEWVLKEAQHALERQGMTGQPDIVPVILEGPPPVLPPESLRVIHFDDRIRYFIAAS